jgi:hypothetical protein
VWCGIAISLFAKELEHAVIGSVLGPERLAPPLGAADGGPRHPAEVDPAVEVGVAAHVDAAPERGVVARGAAPGAAHPRGPMRISTWSTLRRTAASASGSSAW